LYSTTNPSVQIIAYTAVRIVVLYNEVQDSADGIWNTCTQSCNMQFELVIDIYKSVVF